MPDTQTSSETLGKCQKCGTTDRHSENDVWCRACRAEYQRAYTETRLERKERRGFALGVKAMRDCMVKEFTAQASASFNGYEIAHLIGNAPGPTIPE